MEILSENIEIQSFSSETIRWQAGDTSKADPFFILVLNNIAIERPLNSGAFVPDMNGFGGGSTDRSLFTDCAEYLYRSVFGKLPGQADKMLGRSPHAAKVKFHSMYVWGLVANGATALASEEMDSGTGIARPRRDAVPRMLAYLGVNPDLVFIVTNSPTHQRASAYPASDHLSGGSHVTDYDGQQFMHYFRHAIPGMATIHATGHSLMTGAHEFGHAFSSYPAAYITDLYADGPAAFNRKTGRPIPPIFATYAGVQYKTDQVRPPVGYPATWTSYHCELEDVSNPALMDNYHYGTPGPLACKNDKITTAFMLDRLAAKVAR